MEIFRALAVTKTPDEAPTAKSAWPGDMVYVGGRALLLLLLLLGKKAVRVARGVPVWMLSGRERVWAGRGKQGHSEQEGWHAKAC